mgnify:CR=1 FL=1
MKNKLFAGEFLWKILIDMGWRGVANHMEIIYGTGNSAKISYMQRALKALPLEIVGVKQAADKKSLTLPEVEETGRTPFENARQKAQEYYRLFHSPVFSCDSGLYLWNHTTGQPLAEEKQPGVHVRRIGGRYTDDELLAHYITLVREYGPIRARYKSAICLIWDEELWTESMDESLWGQPFLLADKPHVKRVEGFPLDSISLDIKTGRYFYDMEKDSQDDLVSERGFAQFFEDFLKRLERVD